MEQFTASNGYEAEPADGVLIVRNVAGHERHVLGRYTIEALREFLQHERDEELGRWRWPENPDYVVYPDEDGDAVVLNERDGMSGIGQTRATVDRYPKSFGADAARAFFEAHPERKPWEEAKEGEVWIIAYEGNEYPSIFQAGQFRDHGGHWTPESVTAARRIWPVSDD